MAKKKNLLRPSSFLLRRSPSNVRSIIPLHRLLTGLYDYHACSVSLKMDVYMHGLRWAPRIAEPKHSREIDRVRSDDVLAKEHCVYERDRRLRCEDEKTSLRLSAMCWLLGFFFSEVDKDVVRIRDRLQLRSKRSSLSLYRLRDV